MKCIHFILIIFPIILGSSLTHIYSYQEKNVTISLKHPKAKTLLFASSLNGYEGQLHKQHNRLREISLPAEKPYRFFYMVNGDSFSPECPLPENNGFGSKICLFEPNV
jgi:hypothetical protein